MEIGKTITERKEMTIDDPDFGRFDASFTNFKPEGDQIDRIETLRANYKFVLESIIDSCPRTPERTIALRKLEESLMYTVKTIVLEGRVS